MSRLVVGRSGLVRRCRHGPPSCARWRSSWRHRGGWSTAALALLLGFGLCSSSASPARKAQTDGWSAVSANHRSPSAAYSPERASWAQRLTRLALSRSRSGPRKPPVEYRHRSWRAADADVASALPAGTTPAACSVCHVVVDETTYPARKLTGAPAVPMHRACGKPTRVTSHEYVWFGAGWMLWLPIRTWSCPSTMPRQRGSTFRHRSAARRMPAVPPMGRIMSDE
jgi:hypothetical protein